MSLSCYSRLFLILLAQIFCNGAIIMLILKLILRKQEINKIIILGISLSSLFTFSGFYSSFLGDYSLYWFNFSKYLNCSIGDAMIFMLYSDFIIISLIVISSILVIVSVLSILMSGKKINLNRKN